MCYLERAAHERGKGEREREGVRRKGPFLRRALKWGCRKERRKCEDGVSRVFSSSSFSEGIGKRQRENEEC